MKYLLGICLGFLTAFCLAGVVNAGDCADASLSIAIVDEAIVESADLSALDGIDAPRATTVYVAEGDTGEATVHAAIVSNGIVGGVQGWSLSALVTGGAITGAIPWRRSRRGRGRTWRRRSGGSASCSLSSVSLGRRASLAASAS